MRRHVKQNKLNEVCRNEKNYYLPNKAQVSDFRDLTPFVANALLSVFRLWQTARRMQQYDWAVKVQLYSATALRIVRDDTCGELFFSFMKY